MVKVGIVGLGYSKPVERPNCDYVIGVNDAPAYCDRIVVVDPISVFSFERQQAIINHKGMMWATQLEWSAHRPMFNFQLHSRRGVMDCILQNEVPQSITSIIPAIGTAYLCFGKKAKYKLYGVDLLDHQSLSRKELIDIIAKDLKAIGKLIDLSFGAVHKDSPLVGVLPEFP